MDTIIRSYLSQLEIGDPTTHKNMTVFPLFHKTAVGPDYITLEEAIEQDLITLEEIDESGSVPNLKVTNKSPHSVLLMDGEEVAGAKQNRLINTSILIRGRTEIVIPVSCSEMGRWAYRSRKFTHSGHISSYSIRSGKMRSVSDSLKRMMGHYSDQGEVWADVAAAHFSMGTSSPTDAMKDMYDQKTDDLKSFENTFEHLPNQRGCAVCLGGEVVALETVSSEDAFKRSFGKILRSFAVEALLSKYETTTRPDHEAVEAFIHEAESCQESRHESVGEGYDFRYESKDMVGSVLVVEDDVVHASIFRLHGREEDSRHEVDREDGDIVDIDDLDPGDDSKLSDVINLLRHKQ